MVAVQQDGFGRQSSVNTFCLREHHKTKVGNLGRDYAHYFKIATVWWKPCTFCHFAISHLQLPSCRLHYLEEITIWAHVSRPVYRGGWNLRWRKPLKFSFFSTTFSVNFIQIEKFYLQKSVCHLCLCVCLPPVHLASGWSGLQQPGPILLLN